MAENDVPVSFPYGDAGMSRTLVFDHPSSAKSLQILVTVYAEGEIEVAQRTAPGASWGPPWAIREVETW